MVQKVYTTLSGPASHTIEVRKSVFRAQARRVGTSERALEMISKLSDLEASHNCWAYRIGPEYRFSDDGEPGGTAGRPIYRAIETHGLDRLVVVVTRYFGGTKLGSGGLVRAYSKVTAECLAAGEKTLVKPTIRLTVTIPFEVAAHVYPILDEFRVKKLGETYLSCGPQLEVRIEANVENEFLDCLRDATSGQIRVRRGPG